MSKEIKQLIKDAKQAFKEKEYKIAEEKCLVSAIVALNFDHFFVLLSFYLNENILLNR